MEPHEEDSWASLRGGSSRGRGGGEEGGARGEDEDEDEILLVAAGGCARCPAVNIDRSPDSPLCPSSSTKQQQQQQPLLELAGYRRSVATGRIEFGVLLQRRTSGSKNKSLTTKTTTATTATKETTTSTSSSSSSSSSSWLSVGDVLYPTLRDPTASCAAAGGASCG
jgi:hypothetical protein